MLCNCINSGLRRIFIATQYKSLSLNRHIRMGWSIVSEELGEFLFEPVRAGGLRARIYGVRYPTSALEAMRRAVIGLGAVPDHLLVDARRIPGITLPQLALVKGDARSFSIAAAVGHHVAGLEVDGSPVPADTAVALGFFNPKDQDRRMRSAAAADL